MDAYLKELRRRLDAPDQADAVAARDAVRALSIPRLTGSDAAAQVERWLRRRFERLGFETRILPFTFSSLPGRFGVPALGVLLLATLLAAAAALIGGRPVLALLALALPLVPAVLVANLTPRWIGRLPWGRTEGRNLVFTRPGARPRYLIAAHRDSKSQPVSTGARLRAGMALALGGSGLGLLALHGTARVASDLLGGWAAERAPETLLGSAREIFSPLLGLQPPGALVLALAAVAAWGAMLMALSWAGNESPGALDNATGVAAALGLAERLGDRDDIGYLITDAEELGLVGARAVAPGLATLTGVVNLDGIDDDGPVHVVERYGFPRRGRAPHLAAALLAAADGLQLDIERHDAPLGMFLEHSAYNDAGAPSLTLLRGNRSALARIHRPADTSDVIGGRGIASVVALVEGALHLLREARETEPSRPLLPGRELSSAQDLRPEPGAGRTPLFAHRPPEEPLPPLDEEPDAAGTPPLDEEPDVAWPRSAPPGRAPGTSDRRR